MNTTEHETILRILEKRAQRFRPELKLVDVQNEWGYQIDDTGTLEVEEESADIVRERELEASLVEMQELQSINDAVLEIHGQRPMEKQDGVIRLVYENVNGIDSRFKDNWKVDKAKDLHDELAVDIAAYNEHKINMKHKQNKVGFNQLFWGGEAKV